MLEGKQPTQVRGCAARQLDQPRPQPSPRSASHWCYGSNLDEKSCPKGTLQATRGEGNGCLWHDQKDGSELGRGGHVGCGDPAHAPSCNCSTCEGVLVLTRASCEPRNPGRSLTFLSGLRVEQDNALGTTFKGSPETSITKIYAILNNQNECKKIYVGQNTKF